MRVLEFDEQALKRGQGRIRGDDGVPVACQKRGPVQRAQGECGIGCLHFQIERAEDALWVVRQRLGGERRIGADRRPEELERGAYRADVRAVDNESLCFPVDLDMGFAWIRSANGALHLSKHGIPGSRPDQAQRWAWRVSGW